MAGAPQQITPTVSPGYAAVLWSLTVLFAIRVAGQATQRWWPQSSLPPFGAFQGSGLPYPLLLFAQVIILALMVRATRHVAAGTYKPSVRKIRFLSWFGGVYMAGSVLRIMVGYAVPTAPPWFSTWIPAFLHLVLAGFVITLAVAGRKLLRD